MLKSLPFLSELVLWSFVWLVKPVRVRFLHFCVVFGRVILFDYCSLITVDLFSDDHLFPFPKWQVVVTTSSMVAVVHCCLINPSTTKKAKISEGYLVRENVKSLSNSVTKFCDQGICEEFHFFRH